MSQVISLLRADLETFPSPKYSETYKTCHGALQQAHLEEDAASITAVEAQEACITRLRAARRQRRVVKVTC